MGTFEYWLSAYRKLEFHWVHVLHKRRFPIATENIGKGQGSSKVGVGDLSQEGTNYEALGDS